MCQLGRLQACNWKDALDPQDLLRPIGLNALGEACDSG